MKVDPEDVRKLAEDLQGALQRHPDAIKSNPDIATDIVKVRDKTFKRYETISEHGKGISDENGNKVRS